MEREFLLHWFIDSWKEKRKSSPKFFLSEIHLKSQETLLCLQYEKKFIRLNSTCHYISQIHISRNNISEIRGSFLFPQKTFTNLAHRSKPAKWMVAKKDRLDETEGEESKDLDRSQKAIPGNLSDNSISSRVEPRWRNLFTGLIMVFRRVHLRFSCFSAAVNGLTTNRLDLHRITNAFTTNLSVCDQSSSPPHSFLPLSFRRDISVYLSFSSPRSLLSSPLTWRLRSFEPANSRQD